MEVVVSGSRRARALVAGIGESLSAALDLADSLDAAADALDAAGGGTEAGGDWWASARRPVAGADPRSTELAHALAVAEAGAPGLAGAPWSAPSWLAATAAGRPPEAVARFRPSLWRVGDVIVPPLDPGGGAARVPLAVPLLDAGNLLIDVGRGARAAGAAVIRSLVTRILATAPPGEVRLTVFDPVELGAGLAGYAPLRVAGVAGPTLTTRTALEAALSDLSAEVGRITVDRLGGQFANLRERVDSGLPRSEPWRLLVLLGWPNVTDEAARALRSLAEQGPACGVHIMAMVERPDAATAPPGRPAPPTASLLSDAVVLSLDDEGGARGPAHAPGAAVPARPDRPPRWRCSLSGPLPCVLDEPPPSDLVASIAREVAAAAALAAARPPDARDLLPERLWSHDSAGGLAVPVAAGDEGPVSLSFDDDTVHALVGGQAGAGKSTLLLDVIYGLAARYGPDQLRFHLLDFKEGLEFAQFAPRPGEEFFLPHADTIGMDSDREFGVAVLRHVRAQMARRAVTMRAVGARDLRGLRMADRASAWPRIMVVIDEFQVMLTPLDAVSREAVGHLEALARQGRAYGIHLLLASQTLSGIDALDATAGKRGSIFGQFALRIALRTSISESRVLLSVSNDAAGALGGVGEAIINRRNGHPAGNERVRVAYPDQAMLAGLRAGLAQAAARAPWPPRPPRVFVGHAPAYLEANPVFAALAGAPAPLLDTGHHDPELHHDPVLGDPALTPVGAGAAAPDQVGAAGTAPLALVGVPLDLAPAAVGVRLSALPGRNLAVLGPRRREAVGVLQAAVTSVAAQLPPGGLAVRLVAGTTAETGAAATLADWVRARGQRAEVVAAGGLRELLGAAGDRVRQAERDAIDGARPGVTQLIVLLAADAVRAGLEAKDPMTRRSGLDELRFLVRRGPSVRTHVIGWWRGPSRLLEDLGPAHRDDIGAWVAVGVAGGELFSLAGHRTVTGTTGANRAILFDRHDAPEPRTVIPFAPLGLLTGPGPGGGAAAAATDHDGQGYGATNYGATNYGGTAGGAPGYGPTGNGGASFNGAMR